MNIIKFNNSILKYDGKWLETNNNIDPYNPLNLPGNTIRIKVTNSYTPDMGDTQTLVDSTNNIWDIYKQSNDWNGLFNFNGLILEVLGANTHNITDMSNMFWGCERLTSVSLYDTSNVTNMSIMFRNCFNLISVPLFDTSNVTNMSNMLESCQSLPYIPLFNTSKVTNVYGMCAYCYSVETGALALYNQMSSQTTPPSSHSSCFLNCGYYTQTGAAELAQIPSDWK